MSLSVEHMDNGMAPQRPPNPAHPYGVDIDLSQGRAPSCWVKLPKVSTGGYLVVTCDVCGKKAALSVAGRPDDPRSLKMDCLRKRPP